MRPFLREVAEEIRSTVKNFENLTLILPGKRAGIFLRNELLKINTKTTYAPDIYSIEEFSEKLSKLKLIENIPLLFELYEVYKKECAAKTPDSFFDFSRWAQRMLQDFNDIDRELADPTKIFSYLASIKEINHWYLQKEKTVLQENYIAFWNRLPTYYNNFRKRLINRGIAYQGLIYREALKTTRIYLNKNPDKQHVFIGFNALNKAEEKLIQAFLKTPNNSIFWDIDAVFLADKAHDAGLFIRAYKKEWDYFKTHPFKYVSTTFKNKKNIQIIGVPKAVGQAKYTGKLLGDLCAKIENIDRTAVILGNEDLLMPVLNALPEVLKNANITCGLPLYHTPVVSFFSALFCLTENKKNGVWYYKEVLQMLYDPLTKRLLSNEKKDYTISIIRKIQRNNSIFISSTFIEDLLPPSLAIISNHIFLTEEQLTVNAFLQNGIKLIYILKEKYHTNDLYLEYLYRFSEIFNQMLYLNKKYNTILTITSLKHVYHELLRGERINFKGEPLKGLQIMGMLESRNLDFENVIITTVNEGILPAGKTQPSFLPFELKKTFGLPTYKEKDALYAYHFYRILQRAKRIYLLYNTESGMLEGREKSRFLLQLLADKQPDHTIVEIIAAPEVSYRLKKEITVKKDPDVITLLEKASEKGFSPTSLSNYIRNPIDFYHRTLLNIKPEDAIEENITARTLGVIIHHTLEELYKPLEGKLLRKADILKMKAATATVVFDNFMKVYHDEAYFSKGKNLISLAIVKRYIQHFLNLELDRLKKGNIIKILHIEKSMTTAIHIPELTHAILLKGTIDRVEEVDGTIAIMDYKTGKVVPSDIKITSATHILDPSYHKAFQLLSYAYLYSVNYPLAKKPLEAVIVSFKNLKSGYMKCIVKSKNSENTQTSSTEEDLLVTYEDQCKKLLLELFDVTTPFQEKMAE